MNLPLLPKRTYFATYAALLAGLLLNVGVSFLHLGSWNLAVALILGWVNMALIILFFMRVKFSPPAIWLAAGAALFWMGILFVLTMSDYTTRNVWGKP